MEEQHTIKLNNTVLNGNPIAGIMESVSINHDRISYPLTVQVPRRGKNSLAKSTRRESQYYFVGPSYYNKI